MHEILGGVSADGWMLDLGCASGSFDRDRTAAKVVRLDRQISPGDRLSGALVCADAAQLPFRERSFAAVISNHSLEHIERMTEALREIGRVLRADGAIFIAVPDASTLTDRLYRWLARGGGHVNAFTEASQVISAVESACGQRHVATRVLYSSLSFLNRRNAPRPLPRRLQLLGGGREWPLAVYVWLSRRVDRWLRTRTSVYGWALYFGKIRGEIDTTGWTNVCVRCGSGSPAGRLRRMMLPFLYVCSFCGAINPFSDDAHAGSSAPRHGADG